MRRISCAVLRKISRTFACGMFIGLFFLVEVPLVSAQTSTWTGGAGNWAPCPPTGNARWNTCPTYPDTMSSNAVISGGPVTLATGNGIFVANLTVNAGESVIVTPGYLDVYGTSIVNNGTISIGPSNGMNLQNGNTLTLSGTGSVNLTSPMATFWAANGTSTFTNQQTIQGEGRFSLGMNLINQGTINANVNAGTLSLQPTTAKNTGTMEASSGSTLQFANGLQTAYNNAGGTIQALNGGTVVFQNGIYTGGTLTTTGSGVILAENSAIVNGLTTSGALQVPAGNQASLQNTITNTGTISVPSSTLSMTGAVTLKGTGNLLMSGTGRLNQLNGPGDTLTNQQMIHGAGTIYQLPLTNQGTVAADSNGNTLTLANTTTNTAILEAINGGILDIQNGAAVANTGGTIQAQNNSTVNIGGTVSGGTLTTSGTGTIQSQNGILDGTTNILTNAGLLDVNGFDLFFQGAIKNNGTISLATNCVILNQPSTLTGTGALKMAPATCIFGSGLRFTNSSNIVGAGTIGDSNPMPITNNGSIQANNTTNALFINSGTYGFTNNGKLIVNASSTLNVQGLFNNLTNSGTFTGGTYLVTGTLGVQNSIVTNATNITLTGAAAKISNTNMGTNALATLTTNASAGVLSVQSGQVLMTAGNLGTAGIISVGAASSFKVGGSYTQTAGKTTVDGTLTAPTGLLLQNGTMQGQGTIVAAMTSHALVIAGDTTAKAGKLSVHGSYSEGGTSAALDIAIGGNTVGTQYSQLAVSNGASLGGTLNIKLINGFLPSIGSVFTILTANPISGKFSTVNGLSINSGEHFDIAYTSAAVTLTVASGP